MAAKINLKMFCPKYFTLFFVIHSIYRRLGTLNVASGNVNVMLIIK